ncbi:glutamine amidotransferase [Acetobacterium sp.]|uniref:glutamine amidotransferase n=1 Tax=Acetobacterium sp. TaxID=1872094 RepID=UPI002F40B62D
MGKLLIIKTGASDQSIIKKCGDCDVRIARCAGIPYEDIKVLDVQGKINLISLDDVSSIIITGSPSMVTSFEPWSISTSKWIKNIARKKNIPILGICYGHQLLALTFGGAVGYHDLGEEKGEVEIQLTEAGKKDPLLSVLPDHFKAYAAHFQSVTRLPKDAIVLAKNDFEPFHAVAYGPKIWGVQFHPECNDQFLCESTCEYSYGVILIRRFLELAEQA